MQFLICENLKYNTGPIANDGYCIIFDADDGGGGGPCSLMVVPFLSISHKRGGGARDGGNTHVHCGIKVQITGNDTIIKSGKPEGCQGQNSSFYLKCHIKTSQIYGLNLVV